MNFFEESIFFLKKYLKKFKIITNIIIIAFSKVNFFAATKSKSSKRIKLLKLVNGTKKTIF
ncbi:hypothetical protein OCUAc20_33650 [Acinetobacter baumannii]|nr:hypothetical protein AXK18_03795 [Acinetobacter baumannii]BDE24865.1 hypothetical protein OCUAc20_33650 [Acinetobacter baumannii]